LKVSIKQLLEAGVHFGHQTKRWNPKMKKYIYGEKNGIHIIDLQQTLKNLAEAYNFVVDVTSKGGTVLFVGTKKQAQDIIKEEAERCGMFYVNRRWLGGTLTNFQTIRKSVERWVQLEELKSNGGFENLPKKEAMRKEKERMKLERDLKGIKDMVKLPDIVYIVDPRRERIAVHEAQILGIPIVAIVDTNCDPDGIDYIIPGNDDAIRSIKLITSQISEAVLKGKEMFLLSQEGLEEEVREEAATPKEEEEKLAS